MATNPSELPELVTAIRARRRTSRLGSAVRFMLMLVVTAAFSMVALVAALVVFYVFFILAPFLAGGIVWVLARPVWHRHAPAGARLHLVPAPPPEAQPPLALQSRSGAAESVALATSARTSDATEHPTTPLHFHLANARPGSHEPGAPPTY